MTLPRPSRYDATSVVASKRLQGAEAEAEVSRRLAVARAMPRAMALVGQAFACEAAYQHAKLGLILSLLHAYARAPNPSLDPDPTLQPRPQPRPPCALLRYQACSSPSVAAELAQQMTDLIAERPKLDLNSASFEAEYRAATLALTLHNELLSRLLSL